MNRPGRDGPQAATRHIKDRRPALQSNAAKSLERLEKRLAKLEARNGSSPNSTVPPKLSAASEIDTHVTRLNDMDDKLWELEDQIDVLNRECEDINETILPFTEYAARAATSASQLQMLQDVMEKARMEFPDSELRLRFGEHDDTLTAHDDTLAAHDEALKTIRAKLQEIQDAQATSQNPAAHEQQMSAQDLANQLIARLRHGEVLDKATSSSLRLAFGDTALGESFADLAASRAGSTRLPETPVTDGASAGPDTINGVEESSEPPLKRRRGNSPLARRSRRSMEEVEQANSQLMTETFGNGSNTAVVTRRKKKASTETTARRKSNRQPRPIQGHGDDILWDFADTSVRGFRHSIA